MKVCFTVSGEPKGKGRPRFRVQKGRVFVYTPEDTAAYETHIKTEYQRQCPTIRFDNNAMLAMKIRAYYKIPNTASKKNRQRMLKHSLSPIKKPDWDNIAKVVADSLNQVAYGDDSRIVRGEVEKLYGETPRLEVEIEEIKQEEE